MRIRARAGRSLLVLTIACIAALPPAASAAAQPEGVAVVSACHRLASTQLIDDGQFTVSANGDEFAISDNTPISDVVGVAGVSWARWDRSGRYHSWRSRSYITLTCGGDLQFWHAPGVMLWHSNTAGRGGAHLILNDTGELRLYTADWSHIVWRSRSGLRYLAAGTTLPSGGRMASGGADHHNYVVRSLTMQRDGNLVYRVGGSVRWRSGTHVAGAHAMLNAHAQLVVIGPHGARLWSSRSTGSRLSALDVEFMRIDDYSYPVARSVWQAPGVH